MDQIIDKVIKLLALAEGKGTTAAESSAAAAQAQKLMLKYQISEFKISERENKPKEEILIDKQFCVGGKIITWKLNLISGISKYNSCKILINSRQGNSSLFMFGTKSNMQICKYLFTYLSKEIERLTECSKTPYGVSVRSFKNSFRVGAALEVVRRLKESKEDSLQEIINEGSSSTALVKLNSHEIEVGLVTDKYAGKGSYKQIGAQSYHGYNAGKEAGGKIPINKGIEGKDILVLNGI